MKKIFFLIFGLSFGVNAQQLPLFSNLSNYVFYNPSNVGSRNNPRTIFLHRSQWANINGGYQSSMLSFDTPLFNDRSRISKKPHIGTMVQANVQGKTQAILSSIAYAYPIEISKNAELRLGLQANYHFTSLGNDAVLADQFQLSEFGVNVMPTSNDPLSFQERYSMSKVNFTAGFEYNQKHLWKAGIAFHQFTNLKKPYVLSNIHIYTTKSTQLILMQHLYAGNYQLDLNFLGNVNDILLYGAGYRGIPLINKGNILRNNGLILLGGLQFDNNLSIMGSFDLGLSNTRQATRNSFEVSIKYSLTEKYCPAYEN